MQQTSDKPTWIQFFKNASIPTEYVQNYANKFIENRIRFDMLGDLDRPLLNEMGITAIGDCLSILKHAKIIIQKIEEDKKEPVNSSTKLMNENTDSASKKRNEVAKRIIESYLNDVDSSNGSLEKSSATVTKTNQSTSNLSSGLISRLNFNPNASSSTSNGPKILVTINDDYYAGSTQKVTSTTDDETVKTKRSIDDVYETSNSKNLKRIHKSTSNSVPNNQQLEYRGLLKHTPSSISSTKLTPDANTTKKPIKSRLSLNVDSTKTTDKDTDSSIISNRMQGQISAHLENIRIQASSASNTANNKKPSVFSRLNMSSTMTKTTSQPDSTTRRSLGSNVVTSRLLGDFGALTKKNEDTKIDPIKITITNTTAEKIKPIPITFDKNDIKKSNSTLKSTVSTNNKISLSSSSSFSNKDTYDKINRRQNVLDRIKF